MTRQEERRHLLNGVLPGEAPSEAGLTGILVTSDDPETLVSRCREVMLTIVSHSAATWPDPSAWQRRLPGWFLEKCPPDNMRETNEEWLNRWHEQSHEGRVRMEREASWTLDNWLFWMKPENRLWSWWDAVLENPNQVRIQVELIDIHAPLGALEWLLRCAGAVDVSVEA